ncbi:MAG: hypothetical protein CMA09_05265 [Euryarchaeota archaeon]|nr:hypothetical protein [Euryarchaeota archaeon]
MTFCFSLSFCFGLGFCFGFCFGFCLCNHLNGEFFSRFLNLVFFNSRDNQCGCSLHRSINIRCCSIEVLNHDSNGSKDCPECDDPTVVDVL